MSEFLKDPIINAINEGIRKGIQVAIDNKCYSSAVILIYAGMDAMAYLNMPATQEDVTRTDFINWSERYIKFPCKEQLNGKDLYGARCAMLHNHSVFSKMSRNGECRNICYMDISIPEIRYDKAISESVVLVSIQALAEAFFNGINQFLIDLFSDKEKSSIAEKRLDNLVITSSTNSLGS